MEMWEVSPGNKTVEPRCSNQHTGGRKGGDTRLERRKRLLEMFDATDWFVLVVIIIVVALLIRSY